MPVAHRPHPTDVLADELSRVYKQAGDQLRTIVGLGLSRGLDPSRAYGPDAIPGDATLNYRTQQLGRARAILRDLDAQTAAMAPRIVATSYRASLETVDAVLGPGLDLTGSSRVGFATIHHRAVEVLTANMTATLSSAVREAGVNVATVFERADALSGALPTPQPGAVRQFIGRRINDPYRQAALQTLAEGTIKLDTRRQISAALERRLINDGITDAITGFVDRAGRRWPLDVYAEMVARTTTREASSRATINRLLEGNAGIVTISTHPHKADACTPYDGKTFALTAEDAARDGLGRLDRMPPFHPRCRHVVTAGVGNLDAYEAELERRVREGPPARVRPDDVGDLVEHNIITDAQAASLEAIRVSGRPAGRGATLDVLRREGLVEQATIGGISRYRTTAAGDAALTIRARYAALRDEGYEARDARILAGLEGDDFTAAQQELYDEFREREDRRLERERGAGRGGADKYRCWNCQRFVIGKRARCNVCGYDHNGPGAHEASLGGMAESTRERRERLRREHRKSRGLKG